MASNAAAAAEAVAADAANEWNTQDEACLKHLSENADEQEKGPGAVSVQQDEAPRPSGRNVKTKEQRRAEAEARQAQSRALRSTKRRLAEVEAALLPAQERYAELMELMASEELYNDSDAFDKAMREYTALSKKIPLLEEEWLELTEKIEGGA